MIEVKDRQELMDKIELTNYKMLNILGILRNTNQKVMVDDLENPKSFWMQDHYFNFLYSDDEQFIEEFSQAVGEAYFGFSGTTDEVFDYFNEHEMIQWKSTCGQYHYDGEPFDIAPLDFLTLEDAEYVDKHYEYNNDHSLEKIKDAILNRPTSCLRKDGVLISFVLLHDDDSIGYMYTLPEHRGKGYAYMLTKDILNKTMASGRLPYIQIVKGNTKSEQLAEKAGFKKHGEVHWFGVVTIGEHFQQYIKRYETLYDVKPCSVGVKMHLDLNLALPSVEVTKEYFILDDQKYPYECVVEDDIYYVKCDMPEEILLSGLKELMKAPHEMSIVNGCVRSKALKKLTIE